MRTPPNDRRIRRSAGQIRFEQIPIDRTRRRAGRERRRSTDDFAPRFRLSAHRGKRRDEQTAVGANDRNVKANGRNVIVNSRHVAANDRDVRAAI